MQLNENRMRSIIAQGLTGMFFLLLCMFITDYVEYGMKGDFSALNHDPGLKGIWILTFVMCMNVLMQIAIQTFNNNTFKWLTFGFAVLYTLFFVMHQVGHALQGETFDMHTIFDVTHHIIGIWTTVAAYKWARFMGEEVREKVAVGEKLSGQTI